MIRYTPNLVCSVPPVTANSENYLSLEHYIKQRPNHTSVIKLHEIRTRTVPIAKCHSADEGQLCCLVAADRPATTVYACDHLSPGCGAASVCTACYDSPQSIVSVLSTCAINV